MPRPSDEEKILEEFGITVTADEPFTVMPRFGILLFKRIFDLDIVF